MKYIAVEKTLSEKISRLPAGAKLPTYKELYTELDISQSTLDRVLRSLEEKGAITKRRGSGIFVSQNGNVKNRTFNIGVLVSDITNRFCALLVRGIEAGLSARGYRMLLCNGTNELQKEIDLISSMREKIDALIVFPTTSNALNSEYASSLMELERKTGTPFVFVNMAVNGLGGNFVGFDEYGALLEVTSFLIQKVPDRRIIYLGQAGSIIGAERFLGFEDALLRMKIPVEKVGIHYFSTKFRNSYGQVIADIRGSPSIVVAANPDLLMGLINIARRKNVRIPEDMIVAGVVEEDYRNYLDAPVVALVKPSTEMGGKAAQMTLDILSGAKGVRSCRLKLTIRVPDEVKKFLSI
ncbi:MAG: substrate-binding domain-containing protein [Victivallales bacterium]|jgi:DNA-binding LacI/PurR family transcriptional regulator